MSRSTPPTTPCSSSSSSLATSTPPFSTTSPARLQALYSDFSRQKQSNPTSYHANVDWWKKALEALVSSGKQEREVVRDGGGDGGHDDDDLPMKSERLVLHAGRDLIERLKIPKVGKPLALGAVLFELQHVNRGVLPFHLFMSTKTSIYDPGWLPTRIAKAVMGRPVWWVLEQMGIVGEEGILLPEVGRGRPQQRDTNWWGDYVLISLVEKAAVGVMERQERRGRGSRTDVLYTMEEFRKVFGGVASGDGMLGKMDASILVRYLERDKEVLVVDKEVIKFVDKTSPLEERTITAVDRGILELKTAVSNLHAQVDALHGKIDECTKKAAAALRQNRKPAALGHLKSRKLLEDVLQKRLGSLTTLESTFFTVEAAAGDVEIMKSYESSATTLRTILSHPALQRSKIEETMEALAEANVDAKEIDDAIRVGADVAVGVVDAVNEEELEEEWKAMVRELESEKEIKKEEQRQKLEEAVTPGDIPVLEKMAEATT